MKTILRQLKLFIQQQPKGYVITLMLIGAVSVYCNYHFGIEDQIYEFGKLQRFFAFAGLYAIHFYLAYLLYSVFTG
ncbi:MAG: hypothetical protein H7321_02300, partial [Bacteroidia bacterium]|nr:hypothetical protein [Bacteroidia bacterium]